MKIENGFIEIGQIKLPVSILTLLAHQAHYLILTYFPQHRRFSVHIKANNDERIFLIIENTSFEEAAMNAKEFGTDKQFQKETYSIIEIPATQFYEFTARQK